MPTPLAGSPGLTTVGLVAALPVVNLAAFLIGSVLSHSSMPSKVSITPRAAASRKSSLAGRLPFDSDADDEWRQVGAARERKRRADWRARSCCDKAAAETKRFSSGPSGMCAVFIYWYVCKLCATVVPCTT